MQNFMETHEKVIWKYHFLTHSLKQGKIKQIENLEEVTLA